MIGHVNVNTLVLHSISISKRTPSRCGVYVNWVRIISDHKILDTHSQHLGHIRLNVEAPF